MQCIWKENKLQEQKRTQTFSLIFAFKLNFTIGKIRGIKRKKKQNKNILFGCLFELFEATREVKKNMAKSHWFNNK